MRKSKIEFDTHTTLSCDFCKQKFSVEGRLRRYCTKKCESKAWLRDNQVRMTGLKPDQKASVRDLVAALQRENGVPVTAYAGRS